MLGLLSLSAATNPGSGAAANGESEECRFLSSGEDGAEARVPLAPDRLAALLEVLAQSPVGGLIVAELERLHTEGIGAPERPLRLLEVRREGGPAAEYFETGELYVRSSRVAGLADDSETSRAELYTAASFVVPGFPGPPTHCCTWPCGCGIRRWSECCWSAAPRFMRRACGRIGCGRSAVGIRRCTRRRRWDLKDEAQYANHHQQANDEDNDGCPS